jgi:predicted phosphoribosyltransferase
VWDLGGLAAAGFAPADLAEEVAAERAECRRRVTAYRSGRRGVPVAGRTVVVVDDGVATGVSARAALRSLRDAGAARLVLAAPVVAAQTMAALETEADEVVTLVVAQRLGAVSRWYADFRQTTDDQVVRLLHEQSG